MLATVPVPLVRWPAEADRRDQLADAGLPRLLVLASDEPPPMAWDDLEDWVRSPLDPDEVEHRRATLRRRHQASNRRAPSVDGDGVLHVGDDWLALSPLHEALVRPLVASVGRPVARRVVIDAFEAAGGSVDPQSFRSNVNRLRQRLEPLGLRLHSLNGRALLLEG